MSKVRRKSGSSRDGLLLLTRQTREKEPKMAEPTKRLNSEEFADMLDSYCNNFSTDFRQGVEIGKNLQVHHRTIQATVFRFIIGIAVGIGKDVKPNRMDARNEQAVICSQQIADMIADDHLALGGMV